MAVCVLVINAIKFETSGGTTALWITSTIVVDDAMFAHCCADITSLYSILSLLTVDTVWLVNYPSVCRHQSARLSIVSYCFGNFYTGTEFFLRFSVCIIILSVGYCFCYLEACVIHNELLFLTPVYSLLNPVFKFRNIIYVDKVTVYRLEL